MFGDSAVQSRPLKFVNEEAIEIAKAVFMLPVAKPKSFQSRAMLSLLNIDCFVKHRYLSFLEVSHAHGCKRSANIRFDGSIEDDGKTCTCCR